MKSLSSSGSKMFRSTKSISMMEEDMYMIPQNAHYRYIIFIFCFILPCRLFFVLRSRKPKQDQMNMEKAEEKRYWIILLSHQSDYLVVKNLVDCIMCSLWSLLISYLMIILLLPVQVSARRKAMGVGVRRVGGQRGRGH